MDREVFTPAEERDAHFAAMQWFEAQQMSGHELLTHKELMEGFSWHGHRFRLTHQSQGIWKPQPFAAALTFKTAAPTPGKEAPYADRIDDSGLLRYKFSETKKWANDAMKVAAQRRYPLARLVGIKSTPSTLFYNARFPRRDDTILLRSQGLWEDREEVRFQVDKGAYPSARLPGTRTQRLPDLLRSLRSSTRTAPGSLTHYRRLQGSRRP